MNRIFLIMFVIIGFAMTLQSHAAEPDQKFFEQLFQKEASGRLNPPDGDGGAAIGPYQIHRGYWFDAQQYSGIGGKYEDCRNKEYAEKVVKAYMKRYARQSRLGRKPTYQDLARIHNGGPNGYKKVSTVGYWRHRAFDPLR